MGGRSGNGQIRFWVVKPCARRSGLTSSSALQMVGVSNARSASSSASFSGASGKVSSLGRIGVGGVIVSPIAAGLTSWLANAPSGSIWQGKPCKGSKPWIKEAFR